jgi:nicotinate-nucleotide--dimethylbenzimidazole phosphoribosyltransferase
MTETLQKKIDQKTKPVGALGQLEKLALQIGTVQQSTFPTLEAPYILVFAGDHGIADQGVSAYPKSVTYQMVLNFLQGGAAINVFCRQHGLGLKIIDAGVDHDFEQYDETFLDHKIRKSTHDFMERPAMERKELDKCFAIGQELIGDLASQDTNVVGFGEMGIGNTSAAALVMHRLTGIALSDCTGKGTGLDEKGLIHKIALLEKANKAHAHDLDPMETLQTFGGFEMVQMTGAMLAAAQKGMLILIDGFIATSCFLAAYKISPDILGHAIFCHASAEKGHRLLLEYLGASPILSLGMRLGEGTGCALAW